MSDLVIGLEVHVQLASGKLFCRCPVEESGPDFGMIHRKLKPTSGEYGNIDRAALYEEERSRSFTYDCPGNTCLVEFDEEPPRALDSKALQTTVDIAGSMHCRILKRLEFMRKIVIDGSNTSGFQRTVFLASDGYIETREKKVRISSICLEEDSCRKVNTDGDEVRYSLGRQGIPLVEIATEPDIIDPDHAVETARTIGMHAVLTGNTRHDADSIRQDVNMSMGHGRVEIKGVSRLSHIKEALEAEIARQKMLEKVSSIVKKRGGFKLESLNFKDITDIFSGSKSKMISRSLDSGNRVFASALRNLSGVLKSGDLRLGQELGDLAKAFAVGGVIHSDELPGYGLDQGIKDKITKKFKCSDDDAFIVVLCSRDKITVLEPELAKRICNMIDLDLSETRYFASSGRTAYLRPLPGSGRMYPETDIQPLTVPEEDLKHALELGKTSIDSRLASISKDYGISAQDAQTLVTSVRLRPFKDLAGSVNPRLAVRLILQKIPELEKKYGNSLDIATIISLVERVKKQGLPDISAEYAVEMLISGKEVDEIMQSEKLIPLSSAELKKFVDDLVREDDTINTGKIMSLARSELDRPFDPKELVRILNGENYRKKHM